MKTRNIVSHFRGEVIPAYVKNKSQLVAYVLVKYRNSTPISNGEFVFDLRCTRFGAIIHNLRHNDGWIIETVQGKEQGHFVFYLVSKPDDDENGQSVLRLV
jgi:hypothetical protein